jgi:hypothetical protein
LPWVAVAPGECGSREAAERGGSGRCQLLPSSPSIAAATGSPSAVIAQPAHRQRAGGRAFRLAVEKGPLCRQMGKQAVGRWAEDSSPGTIGRLLGWPGWLPKWCSMAPNAGIEHLVGSILMLVQDTQSTSIAPSHRQPPKQQLPRRPAHLPAAAEGRGSVCSSPT